MARNFDITHDISKMKNFLERLPTKTNAVAVVEMGTLLATIFEQTQQDVHVRSGRLRSSGRMHVSRTFFGLEGEITYGGPSAPYAGTELYHGGDHDFFRNIYQHYPTATKALKSVFEKAKLT